jgi:hypothetical protein
MSPLNILQFMRRLRQLLRHHGPHGRRSRRHDPPAQVACQGRRGRALRDGRSGNHRCTLLRTRRSRTPHLLTNRRGLYLQYRLAGISIPLLWCPEVSGRMSHLLSSVGSRELFRIVVTNYDVHRLFLLMRNCGIHAWVGSRQPTNFMSLLSRESSDSTSNFLRTL